MSKPDFHTLAQPGIKGLKAYDPGLDLVSLRRQSQVAGKFLVELGSNENSLGPSPRAREALLDCLHELHRYPDPLGGDLKLAIASCHGLDTAQVMLGNGSHELLMMIAQVFAGPANDVVISQYGFAVYALATQAAGAQLCVAPAFPREHAMPRGHDLEAIRRLVSYRTRIVYLANPNNPTGTWFSSAELASFLSDVPAGTLVVVDEAYHEYVTDPALPSATRLLDEYPNLIVARTFSKAYGLAGLRLGFIAAHPELISVMERVRESFNVNLPALAAAGAAIYDQDHIDWVRDQNGEARLLLAQHLRDRGLFVADSQTNFLLVDFERDARPIEAALVERNIVPRPMGGYGLPTCLRITVGNIDENRLLMQALDEILA